MTRTFKITWSNLDGKFGWSTIEDCEEMDEAISYWMNCMVGAYDIPYDAMLDHIQTI